MEVSGQIHALAALFSGKEPPCAHWMGGSAGPRSGLVAMEDIKVVITSGDRTPAVHRVALRYTDRRLTV
jgi:hypothetical protein